MTKQELLIEFNEEITDINGAEIFFAQLALTNTDLYNTTKLLEELAELSEKLLKNINKHPDYKPAQKEIIDEMGDVFARLIMYGISKDISEKDIEARLVNKANKLRDYIKEGIYENL